MTSHPERPINNSTILDDTESGFDRSLVLFADFFTRIYETLTFLTDSPQGQDGVEDGVKNREEIGQK